VQLDEKNQLLQQQHCVADYDFSDIGSAEESAWLTAAATGFAK